MENLPNQPICAMTQYLTKKVAQKYDNFKYKNRFFKSNFFISLVINRK